jgi:hypothetical protein
MYAEKCRHSAKSMNDPQSVAEFEAMAFDLEDWANDPAVSSPSRPAAKTYRRRAAAPRIAKGAVPAPLRNLVT